MTTTQTELHNRLSREAVFAIVGEPLAAGGDTTDVLVVLESVILGVTLAVVKLGGDEVVLDTVIERVKGRLAEQRLGNFKTRGTA